MPATRDERIATRTRNDKWKNAPLRIEMLECINCDACLRHCPPHFGAIFNHGPDVVIIGDSVHDVLCGRDLGVRAVAVATGRTSPERLAEVEPDALLADFSDTTATVAAILDGS